ncbi:hypothetical protein H6G81_21415 [Scytonema hofmannii FACHB-248]|uniref:Uncharacterized protein n=1 Tax=Scytonema hofmannii FACHB-248 TaxID=1842502 RepID=A0ABR8GV66_9CYAN|nr:MULTISPECIES: hypothetical protein [Nostocales]MBD2607015.1 hypothetical protein [Scytonema hofmannii FACHB-248]
MATAIVKPSSLVTTGIRVEKLNNLNLFKFTEQLGLRMQELLDKKKADLLTSEEAAELEAIGELDVIFSYINAMIASQV